MAPTAFTVSENETAVATLSMSDPDSDDFFFSLVAIRDSALFEIDQDTGALRFQQAPDFETPGDTFDNPNFSEAGDNIYHVRVQVNDKDGAIVPVDVTVTVADVDETVADLSLVQGNDWFDPDTGQGGYNATFALHLTDLLVPGDSVSDWTLDLDLDDPQGSFNAGWLDGFNAPVSFDAATGSFSTVGQGYQLALEPTDTITFTVQVLGTGFAAEDFSANFLDLDLDLDPEPVVPDPGDSQGLSIDASGLNDWGAGAVQQITVTNTGAQTVDSWQIALDLDPGELANVAVQTSWGASLSEEGGDLLFTPLAYAEELVPGESVTIGFQADILDDTGAFWTQDDFSFV